MDDTQGSAGETSLLFTVGFRDIAQTFIVGAVVGLLVWGLSVILHQYVFAPIMCHTSSAKCADSSGFSLVSAQIIAAITGLVALIRLRIYRPLLVVLAASLALWDALNVLPYDTEWMIALSSVIIFAIGYTLFMMLARIRSLVFAGIIMLIVLIAVRLALVS